MKIHLKGLNKIRPSENSEIVESFLKFLQSKVPISQDLQIHFLEHRPNRMTTGMRLHNNTIGILVKDRLLIDILRTLAHEWVHEFQYQKQIFDKNKKYPDIGGPLENMANILAGIFIKKFEKQFPEIKSNLYGE